MAPAPCASTSWRSRGLRSVPGVAITATRRLRLAATAGFTPGSTPTKACSGQRARSAAMAWVVAVLQATSTRSAPWSSSQALSCRLRATTQAAGRSPQGVQAVSAT